MDRFIGRLEVMKRVGFEAAAVLDVGAYKGHFARAIRQVFPGAAVYMFEANEAHVVELARTALELGSCELSMGLLGAEAGREVAFYTIEEKGGLVSTGSSMYREKTVYYDEPIVRRMRTSTIDGWYESAGVGQLAWRESGIVKLDVQGAELDVLRGAARFIEACRPRYYLLEVSVKEYNEGAPLVADVFAFMRPLARMVDVFDLSYDAGGALLQMDVLFERG